MPLLALALSALLLGDPAGAAPTSATSTPAMTSTTGGWTTTTTCPPTTTTQAASEPTTDHQTVFLATGQDFPDALAAASARSGSSTTVLLTLRDKAPRATVDAIGKLHPQEIVIVGGTAAVSDSVMTQIENLKIGRVIRVGGKDRYETAALLSQLALPGVDDFPSWAHWLLLALVFVYGVGVFGLEWWGYLWTSDRVVRATIAGLSGRVQARMESLEGRRHSLTDEERDQPEQLEKVIGILAKAAEDVKPKRHHSKPDVLGAWRQLHEADVQWVRAAPEAEVRSRFPVVAVEVSSHKSALAGVMASVQEDKAAPLWKLRETLGPALAAYYMDRDNFFESLSMGADQARLLTYIGLAVIAVVGMTLGRQPLLLLGAVGGLLSRLIGAVKQPPSKTDYGASWSRAFLSPVVGALGGWAGTPVVHLLTIDPLNLLNPNLGGGWDHPFHVVSLAVAFLLGFSERLLPAVIGTAASALSGSKGGTSGATPASGDGGGGGWTPPPNLSISGGGGPGPSGPPSAGAAAAPLGVRLTRVIPDVAGLEPLTAAAWLEDLGLTVTLADPGHSTDQAAGLSTGTTPPAGSVVRTGSSVTVNRSSDQSTPTPTPTPTPDPPQASE